MVLMRRAMAAGAAVMWMVASAGVGLSVAGYTDGLAGNRLVNFALVSAATLTLTCVHLKYVITPRVAYRLGWQARDRQDHAAEAEVVPMRMRRGG